MRIRLALVNAVPYRLDNNLSAPLTATGITLAPTTAEITQALASYEAKLKALRLNLETSVHNALEFLSTVPTFSNDERRAIQRVEFASGNLPDASSITSWSSSLPIGTAYSHAERYL